VLFLEILPYAFLCEMRLNIPEDGSTKFCIQQDTCFYQRDTHDKGTEGDDYLNIEYFAN